jgi:hypothetical protein
MSTHQLDSNTDRRQGSAASIGTLLAGGQCLGGAVLLLRPDPVRRALSSGGSSPPPAWVVRLLGGRLIAQGIVTTVRRDRAVVLTSVGVDIVHAASMILTAALLPRYRRPALISAAAASGSAALALLSRSPLSLSHHRRPLPSFGRPDARTR